MPTKCRKGALCQFWKIVTGQDIVDRISRHEAEVSLLGLEGLEGQLAVHCLQKASPGAMDFRIHFFLINFTKLVAYTGLSAPLVVLLLSLPPAHCPQPS